MNSIFQDVIFNDENGWNILYEDDCWFQRYLISGTKIFSETKAIITSTPERIIPLLKSDWNWWEKGKIANVTLEENGTSTFHMWPVGIGVKICVQTHKEIKTEQGWRIQLDVKGHVNGTAYFDISSRDEKSSILIGRFAGMDIIGFLPYIFGRKGFAIRHLNAERGYPGFPFRSGTGWPGLIKRLIE